MNTFLRQRIAVTFFIPRFIIANVTIRWAIDNSINKQATIPTITIPEEPKWKRYAWWFCRFIFSLDILCT